MVSRIFLDGTSTFDWTQLCKFTSEFISRSRSYKKSGFKTSTVLEKYMAQSLQIFYFTLYQPTFFGICDIYFDRKVLSKLRILLCHPAGGRRASLLHQGAESHGTRLVRQQRHRSAPLHVRCTENKTCSFRLDDFKVAWQRMIKKMSKVMTVNTGIII